MSVRFGGRVTPSRPGSCCEGWSRCGLGGRVSLPDRQLHGARRRPGRGRRAVREGASDSIATTPAHLFELAYINDLYGNDEEAVQYYQRCISRPPVPLAALINLGVLHEDAMDFRKAEACYQQVLNYDPNHPRARLFFKDCRASRDMYYDEETEEHYKRLSVVLETPVTDFELSVRSRNCLRKMNIRTLGDLTRTTEMQLLSSKNFGETSLSEIKEMMTSKGLAAGHGARRCGPVDRAGSVIRRSPKRFRPSRRRCWRARSRI